MDSIRSASGFSGRRVNADLTPTGSEATDGESLEHGSGEQQPRRDSYDESLRPAEEMTPEEEMAEGDRHEAELLEKYGLCEDESMQSTLWSLFEQLEPRMQRPEIDYDFACLDTDIPFASSCPNGAIYFTRGLVERLQPGEVLFFAAHELAHTELRHYATRYRRLSDLRLSIPAPPGSTIRLRLDQAAVLSVRHQEEFEADYQAAAWLGPQPTAPALRRLHHVCRAEFPASLQRPTHPPFEKRVYHLENGLPFPPPLEYLYGLLG